MRREGNDAVLTVRDQGVGIPAADLPRVFERFARARNVVGRIGGSGIGLAAVKQIVEEHGGAIAVESEEGAGSTFTIRLPLAAPAPSQRDGTGPTGDEGPQNNGTSDDERSKRDGG
jgi:signal transduction histidine kinase